MSSPVKVSRNDPCPCGSGRKYKRCCYAKAAPLVQGPDGELAHELPIGPEMGEILERQREKFIARFCEAAPRVKYIAVRLLLSSSTIGRDGC
jgi:hypothetical protein